MATDKASLLDHPLVSGSVFAPRRNEVRDVFLVDCEGARLACYRRVVDPDAGTLLHFHGNGETVSDYATDFADFFAGMAVNVCFAEYRGYGGSTGSPTLTALLRDAECVFQVLAVPEERVAVYGRSLGSVCAVELAGRHSRLAGVIVESGIADVLSRIQARITADKLGCTEAELAAEVRRSFDHRAKLAGYRGPLLVIHAEKDGLIDRSHADRLHAWAGGADKRLLIFQKGNHNTVVLSNLVEYQREVSSFLSRIGLTAR